MKRRIEIYIYIDKIEKKRGNVCDLFTKRGVLDSKIGHILIEIFFISTNFSFCIDSFKQIKRQFEKLLIT